MSLVFDESFDTGIPPSMSYPKPNPGSPNTMTYNAALKAVDFKNTVWEYTGLIIDDSLSLSEFNIEIEVEYLNGFYYALIAAGGSVDKTYTTGMVLNLRHNDVASIQTGLYYGINSPRLAFHDTTMQEDNSRVIIKPKTIYKINFIFGKQIFNKKLFIIGIILLDKKIVSFNIAENNYFSNLNLIPCLNFYLCDFRLHSIKIFDNIDEYKKPINTAYIEDTFSKIVRPGIENYKVNFLGIKDTGFVRYDSPGHEVISGIVTVNDIPASRPVRLHERKTGLVVGQTFSRADGYYKFENLSPNLEYYEVAFDDITGYNLVGRDKIKLGRL